MFYYHYQIFYDTVNNLKDNYIKIRTINKKNIEASIVNNVNILNIKLCTKKILFGFCSFQISISHE